MRDALTFVARAHPVAWLALRDTFLTGAISGWRRSLPS